MTWRFFHTNLDAKAMMTNAIVIMTGNHFFEGFACVFSQRSIGIHDKSNIRFVMKENNTDNARRHLLYDFKQADELLIADKMSISEIFGIMINWPL